MSAQTGPDLSTSEALDIATLLRAKAKSEAADAEGRMHNASIARVESAKRLNALAERLEGWVDAERAAENARASGGVRQYLAARRNKGDGAAS